MAKAIRFSQTGGPEVLHWEEVQLGEPGEGQARIRHTAVGGNFIDTYHRLKEDGMPAGSMTEIRTRVAKGSLAPPALPRDSLKLPACVFSR